MLELRRLRKKQYDSMMTTIDETRKNLKVMFAENNLSGIIKQNENKVQSNARSTLRNFIERLESEGHLAKPLKEV